MTLLGLAKKPKLPFPIQIELRGDKLYAVYKSPTLYSRYGLLEPREIGYDDAEYYVKCFGVSSEALEANRGYRWELCTVEDKQSLPSYKIGKQFAEFRRMCIHLR